MTDWWVEVKGGSAAPAEGKRSIAQFKKDVPMERLLHFYGVRDLPDMGEYGDWFAIRCPFHPDNRPSASLNRKLNRFRCHTCDVGGDILDVVEQVEGLDTKGAMEWLTAHLV